MQSLILKGVFSAQPGPAIIKFWQGRVEIVLRGLAIVLGFITLIVTAYDVSQLRRIIARYRYYNLPRNVYGRASDSAGWLVFVVLVVMLYEILVILVRFINFNFINAYSKIVFLADACISGVIAFLLLIGASVLASTEVTGWEISLGVAFNFLLMFEMVALSIWMVVSLVLKWHHHLIHHVTIRNQQKNEEVVQYSITDN